MSTNYSQADGFLPGSSEEFSELPIMMDIDSSDMVEADSPDMMGIDADDVEETAFGDEQDESSGDEETDAYEIMDFDFDDVASVEADSSEVTTASFATSPGRPEGEPSATDGEESEFDLCLTSMQDFFITPPNSRPTRVSGSCAPLCGPFRTRVARHRDSHEAEMNLHRMP